MIVWAPCSPAPVRELAPRVAADRQNDALATRVRQPLRQRHRADLHASSRSHPQRRVQPPTSIDCPIMAGHEVHLRGTALRRPAPSASPAGGGDHVERAVRLQEARHVEVALTRQHRGGQQRVVQRGQRLVLQQLVVPSALLGGPRSWASSLPALAPAAAGLPRRPRRRQQPVVDQPQIGTRQVGRSEGRGQELGRPGLPEVVLVAARPTPIPLPRTPRRAGSPSAGLRSRRSG